MIQRENPPVIVYYPKSDQAKRDLAERVADTHAETVNRRIRELNCPTAQKRQLLDAVIISAKQCLSQETEAAFAEMTLQKKEGEKNGEGHEIV